MASCSHSLTEGYPWNQISQDRLIGAEELIKMRTVILQRWGRVFWILSPRLLKHTRVKARAEKSNDCQNNCWSGCPETRRA